MKKGFVCKVHGELKKDRIGFSRQQYDRTKFHFYCKDCKNKMNRDRKRGIPTSTKALEISKKAPFIFKKSMNASQKFIACYRILSNKTEKKENANS